jgi:hypothetical protein
MPLVERSTKHNNQNRETPAAHLALWCRLVRFTIKENMMSYAYKHVNSEEDPAGWKSKIENWLNTVRPRLDGVSGGISNGRDVHMWVREDGDGPPLTLEAIPADEVVDKIHQLLEQGKIATLGFNISDPPYMWVVRKVK